MSSLSPASFAQSCVLRSVLRPSLSPASFAQSCVLRSVLRPSLSPASFAQSCVLRSVLRPSLSPASFAQSCVLRSVLRPSLSPASFAQSCVLRSVLVKEAIHIQRTPRERLLNRDKGWQIPEPWNTTLMMTSSGREACNQEQSIEREDQDPAAMEMDS